MALIDLLQQWPSWSPSIRTHFFQILLSLLTRILLKHQTANLSLLFETLPCSSLTTDSSFSSLGGHGLAPAHPSRSIPMPPHPTFHLTLQQWSTLFAGRAAVPTGCCCALYTKPHPNCGHWKGTLFVFPSPTQISNPQGSLPTERETLRRLLLSSLWIIYSLFPAPSTTLRCSRCAMNICGIVTGNEMTADIHR